MNKTYSIITGLCVTLFGALLWFEQASSHSANGNEVQLFFTADLHGYLKPCG
jgi:hypothetical protein